RPGAGRARGGRPAAGALPRPGGALLPSGQDQRGSGARTGVAGRHGQGPVEPRPRPVARPAGTARRDAVGVRGGGGGGGGGGRGAEGFGGDGGRGRRPVRGEPGGGGAGVGPGGRPDSGGTEGHVVGKSETGGGGGGGVPGGDRRDLVRSTGGRPGFGRPVAT